MDAVKCPNLLSYTKSMIVTYGPKTKPEHEFDEIVGRKWAKTSGQTQSIGICFAWDGLESDKSMF